MHKRLQSGFTVIEVLIGIALFALIMPAIILGLISVAQLNDRAADLTKANIIAEAKIETLRNAGYNSISDGTYSFTDELAPTFTKPRNAEYVVASPETGIKTIQINISYTVNDRLKNLSYKSIISELGVAQ